MAGYLTDLHQRVAAFQSQRPDSPRPTAPVAEDLDQNQVVVDIAAEMHQVSEEAPSVGSLGHPELCRRRCIYKVRGPCRNGEACGFCHLSHGEMPRLDKKQRRMLRTLKEADVLELLLAHLQTRVAQTQLQRVVGPVLRLMSDHLNSLPEIEGDMVFTPAQLENINKVLRRMPVSDLLALAPPTHGLSYREILSEALERRHQTTLGLQSSRAEAPQRKADLGARKSEAERGGC